MSPTRTIVAPNRPAAPDRRVGLVWWLALCLFAAVLLPTRAADATTLLAVNTDDLVRHAEAIIVARVVATDSGVPSGGRHPVTQVQLDVERVVVGYAPDRLRLRYLGGRDGDRLLRVEGVTVPEVGEHGLYVVHGGTRPGIHPLVGWSQGHFLLRRDSEGELRVFSHDGRAVIGLRAPDPAAADMAAPALSSGIASDLIVVPGWRPERALPLAQFERILREKAGMVGK